MVVTWSVSSITYSPFHHMVTLVLSCILNLMNFFPMWYSHLGSFSFPLLKFVFVFIAHVAHSPTLVEEFDIVMHSAKGSGQDWCTTYHIWQNFGTTGLRCFIWCNRITIMSAKQLRTRIIVFYHRYSTSNSEELKRISLSPSQWGARATVPAHCLRKFHFMSWIGRLGIRMYIHVD